MWSLKYFFTFLFLSIIYISLTEAQAIEWIFPRTFEEEKPRLVRRERPCIINAGLSQGCDLSDMMYAKMHASKFSSFAGPGK
uniref:Uncharacterized protein n=1 Tax=Panagrolaimus sp. ES5 TaxID=591445 RepID=A0AC34F513_9BILA